MFAYSLSSHSPASAADNSSIPRSRHDIHRANTATEQLGYYPQGLPPVPRWHRGKGFRTFYQSNNNPSSSPMSSLPRLASYPRGSINSSPPDGSANNFTTHSNHQSPLKASQCESSIWSREKSNGSDSSLEACHPFPAPASETSPRPPGGLNKSIQSLLRRGKAKQTKLPAPPSLPSLSNKSKAMNQSSQLHFVCNANADEKQLLQKPSISGSSLKSVPSFGSNVESDKSYSPLATPTFSSTASCLSSVNVTSSSGNTAILTGSLPVSDSINYAGHHACVRMSIIESTGNSNLQEAPEERDEDDSELEDILANLKSIAATKSSRDQDRGPDPHVIMQSSNSVLSCNSDQVSLHLNSDQVSLHVNSDQVTADFDSDQASLNYSDHSSEVSFDAEVDGEDGPECFPLPSWPALSSTSQSPLNK